MRRRGASEVVFLENVTIVSPEILTTHMNDRLFSSAYFFLDITDSQDSGEIERFDIYKNLPSGSRAIYGNYAVRVGDPGLYCLPYFTSSFFTGGNLPIFSPFSPTPGIGFSIDISSTGGPVTFSFFVQFMAGNT